YMLLGAVFFFNATATTEIYTLSLHDALPIYERREAGRVHHQVERAALGAHLGERPLLRRAVDPAELLDEVGVPVRLLGEREDGQDRKSTRLNSSHVEISYAVFCLKKKKKQIT